MLHLCIGMASIHRLECRENWLLNLCVLKVCTDCREKRKLEAEFSYTHNQCAYAACNWMVVAIPTYGCNSSV